MTDLLLKYSGSFMILGGDWNCVMDNTLDRNPGLNITKRNSRQQALYQMLDEVDVVDIWRLMHPYDKDYTFFSNPHKTYSRIDFSLYLKYPQSLYQLAVLGTFIYWNMPRLQSRFLLRSHKNINIPGSVIGQYCQTQNFVAWQKLNFRNS